MIFNITSNLKKFEKEKMIMKKKEKESIETLCYSRNIRNLSSWHWYRNRR